MDSATAWWRFWEFCFVVAGGSFALIVAIVAIRGLVDLRELIEFLKLKRHTPPGTRQD
ncbi:MAG: hypothetical protein ACR2IV_09175 [Bryobacteraceae bacterium]